MRCPICTFLYIRYQIRNFLIDLIFLEINHFYQPTTSKMFEFLLLHRLLLLTVVTSVSAVANCSILLCIVFEEIAFYHIVPIFSTEWLCINCSVSLVHVFEYEMHRFDRKKHIERKPNSIWERLKLHACNRQNGKTFASYFFLCSMHANRWYFFDFLAYFR